MAQYYQLVPNVSSGDDIKRIFTNLDTVQLVHIDDQSNSQYLIPQEESSYVLNDAGNQVQQLVYQQPQPQQQQQQQQQQKSTIHAQQQSYDPTSYLVQDSHENVATSQHHTMQPSQHQQQVNLGQENTQHIYYQTDTNQVVQTNQIMQHVQQPQQVIYQTVQQQPTQQPAQQQQILLHKSPDGRIRHIQTPQVMMTGASINHAGQIEGQQQQHVILQNQNSNQVLVQSQISQQQQHQQQQQAPQSSSQMVAVRPQQRIYYKSSQGQIITYQSADDPSQSTHIPSHVQHSQHRYVQQQQQTQPQRILAQQQQQPQHQQHQSQPQQNHIMSPPATQTSQQGIVFHQVSNQPKPTNQMIPPLQQSAMPQTQQRMISHGNISPNIRLSQQNRLVLNSNNPVRFNNSAAIRNPSPRSYLRNTNPISVTPTTQVMSPNVATQPRITRPRASTPGTRGSRGGRGAKSLVANQVRMNSSPIPNTMQQRSTQVRNLGANNSNTNSYQNQAGVKTYLTDSSGQIQLQQTGGQQRFLSYTEGNAAKLSIHSPNTVQQATQTKARTTNLTNKTQMQLSSQSDDIEDSIQPIFVSKSENKTEIEDGEGDDSNMQFDLNVNSFGQSEEEKKQLPGATSTMNLEEYKQRAKIPARNFIPPNRNSQQNIPVNRVQPMPQQSQQQLQTKQTADPGHVIQTQEIIQNRIQNQNQQDNPVDGIEKGNARMLVILASGEQRLITFTLPRDSCTVQELLEQVNVPFDSSTVIQCVSSKGANIDYVVTVGIPLPPPESRAEWIQNAEASLMLNKADANTHQQPSTPMQQQQQQQQQQQSQQMNQKSLGDADKLDDIVPSKYIPGFYAVCKLCGNCSLDHAKCDRCKRVFLEEPKRYPFGTKSEKNAQGPNVPIGGEKRGGAIPPELMGRPPKSLATLASGHRGRGAGLSVSRGRGRGSLRSLARQAEAAPVILTLSSDDEQDEEKSIHQGSDGTNPPAYLAPLHCEPIINEEDCDNSETIRENVADLSNSADKMCTFLISKLIRIGTHKFQPKEKVTITSKGIRIIAPTCSVPEETICLDIMHREIVKIVAHLSKSLAVLFLYTLPRCGLYIRESLDMKPKSTTHAETPYYNPADRTEPYKRIVIQIENFFEETRSVMKSIFPTTVLEFIGLDDAKELLNRSSAKDKLVRIESSGSLSKLENDQNIRQILIYPPGKGGISINTEDYMCLAIDQYLNDVIIDFYMKYIHLHLPKETQDKTHIFSTFFYKRLTTMTNRQRHSKDDAKLTAAQKRHARVASWTKNVNLFEKDFIVIPINEQSHWFLAIICFPKLKGPVSFDTLQPVSAESVTKKKKVHGERKISLQIGNTTITPLSKREYDAVPVGDDDSERDEAEGDESDLASDDSDIENGTNGAATTLPLQPQSEAIKQPMILIFDSLAGASRNRVVATLRDYLTCEFKAKCKDSHNVYHKQNMPGCNVKVPQQNNFTDCGLFVLQYTESFFKDPIKDYKTPIKQLVNWFENITVTKKREDIAILLKELVGKQHPERLPLPEIQLPTQDGKLIEYTEGEAEFEEDEMDDELEEDEEEEVQTAASSGSPSELNNVKPSTTTMKSKQIIFKRTINDVGAAKSQETVMRKQIRLDEQSNTSLNIGNSNPNATLNANNINQSLSSQ